MADPGFPSEISTLHDVLVESARTGLKRQREDGSFPPGRNYTYDEPETPVRTTSHWLQTLTKAYKISGESNFRDAANLAVDYLLSDEVRPFNATYYCRKIESKDKCNGLVGQAAPILALTRASQIINRPDARTTAEEVFELHPFNERLGLWERIEINGDKLSFDRTLNHQIIFAAAAADLTEKSQVAKERVQAFLDRLEANMHIHPNGLIKHYVRPPPTRMVREVLYAPERRYDMFINELLFHYYSYSSERRSKERGYQTVNLEALSRLQLVFPSHPFWEGEKLSRATEFVRHHEDELVARIGTKHGHPLQGVSIAKVYHRMNEEPARSCRHLILDDLSVETGDNLGIFDTDGIDANTEAALVSRLCDFPNITV